MGAGDQTRSLADILPGYEVVHKAKLTLKVIPLSWGTLARVEHVCATRPLRIILANANRTKKTASCQFGQSEVPAEPANRYRESHHKSNKSTINIIATISIHKPALI